MAKWQDVANIWNNIGEVDLRPIRDEALEELHIAIVGPVGSGRQALAEQMRCDPARPDQRTETPILITGLQANGGTTRPQVAEADLIIVLVDPQGEERQRAIPQAYQWSSAGRKVILILPQDSDQALQPINLQGSWDAPQALYGSVEDLDFLQDQVVPRVMKMLPARHLALGRQFPLFRVPIAQALIADTSLSNAAYALSTGVAEVVPVLNIPLNIADMLVLTKAQAFLVYRLGLLVGYSTRWQDYTAEFGSVVGGGFLWRQIARQLVGLIPIWGIVPKVAVAYTGTYVVGHAVLRWYLTGRHVTRRQLSAMYRQSFGEGKKIAARLLDRVPRPRRRKVAPELPASTGGTVCSNCGKVSAADARFCQYCGQDLSGAAE